MCHNSFENQYYSMFKQPKDERRDVHAIFVVYATFKSSDFQWSCPLFPMAVMSVYFETSDTSPPCVFCHIVHVRIHDVALYLFPNFCARIKQHIGLQWDY